MLCMAGLIAKTKNIKGPPPERAYGLNSDEHKKLNHTELPDQEDQKDRFLKEHLSLPEQPERISM